MRFLRLGGLLVLFLMFLSGNFVFAARPLSTDDAGVVDKGHLEMETGLEYVNQADKEVALSLVIKRGMLDNLDLGIEIPYKFIDFSGGSGIDGVDDIKVMTKYNFREETDSLPAVSGSFSLKTDSGNNDKSLGTGEKEYAINSIFSKSFDAFNLHFNFGYTIKEDSPGQDLRDILTYGLAIEYAVGEKLNLVGEISGENERRYDFDDNLTSGLIGVNYNISENIVCDLGFGFEISEASPDFKITTGLTVGF